MNKAINSKYESIPFIILLGSLTAFDPMSIDMYLPAFEQIGKSFSVGISSVELSLSAFFLGLAFGQLLYGPLADIYGRKKPLLIGMLIYFLASIGCSLSTNIEMFIVFRVLQALGGCSGMVITRAIVSDLFDKKRAAHIYSMLMLVMGVAPILAPIAGGYVTKFFSWRAIFDILAALSFISLICTYLFLPETHPNKSTEKKKKFQIQGYWDLFKDRQFMSYSMSSALMRAAMFAYIAASPFVFITYFGVPADKYGFIFGTNAIGIISASQFNRYILKKFSVESIYKTIMIGSSIIALILMMNSIYLPSLFAVLIPLFFFMVAMGFIFPNSAALALEHQGHRAGMASALLGTLQWVIAFGSSFLISQFHDGTAKPMTIIIFISTILAISCLAFLGKNENK